MEPIKIVIARDARPIIHDKRGPAGRPADITIGSVTTGEPGSGASVTNSGTTTNVVLDFAIPEGVPGTTSWNGIVDKPSTVSGYGITDAATLANLAAHTTNTANPHGVTKAQVGLGNADNTSDAGKPVSTAQAAADSAVASAAAGALSSHTTNTANPHSVTKAQVGLGNADNTSDAGKPVSTAQAAADSAVASAAAGALSTHTTNTANPHAVTKAQVGLGNADNTSDAGKPVSIAQAAADSAVASAAAGALSTHSAAGGTAHPVATATVAGFLAPADKTKLNGIATGATANSSDAVLLARANHTGMQDSSTITGLDNNLSSLIAHTANTSNPHAVTKAQVGLGNADNTSDAGKPVSTAQATALAGKQPLDGDLTAIAGISSNGYLRRTGTSSWTVDASIPSTSISGLGTAATLSWAYGGDVVSDPGKLARYAPDASLSAAILIAKRNDGERGLIGVENGDGFSGVFNSDQLTAHRQLSLPDAHGTVALVTSNTGAISTGDISNLSSWGGSTSITAVGSITSGTWNGTAVSTTRGGLGENYSSASGVPLFTAGVVNITSTTGSGNFARVNSPTFVTPILGAAAAASITVSGSVSAATITSDAAISTASRNVGVTSSRSLANSDNGRILDVTGTTGVDLTVVSGLASGFSTTIFNRKTPYLWSTEGDASVLRLVASSTSLNGSSTIPIVIPRDQKVTIDYLASNSYRVHVIPLGDAVVRYTPVPDLIQSWSDIAYYHEDMMTSQPGHAPSSIAGWGTLGWSNFGNGSCYPGTYLVSDGYLDGGQLCAQFPGYTSDRNSFVLSFDIEVSYVHARVMWGVGWSDQVSNADSAQILFGVDNDADSVATSFRWIRQPIVNEGVYASYPSGVSIPAVMDGYRLRVVFDYLSGTSVLRARVYKLPCTNTQGPAIFVGESRVGLSEPPPLNFYPSDVYNDRPRVRVKSYGGPAKSIGIRRVILSGNHFY